MRSRDYAPLALMPDLDIERASEILAVARAEVEAISADAVESLRALLPAEQEEKGRAGL